MSDSGTALSLLFADNAAEREIQDPVELHILRCGILVRLLMLLEQHGVNFGNPEVDALREIRNAVIHNGGDLSQNRNRNALSIVRSFFSDLTL